MLAKLAINVCHAKVPYLPQCSGVYRQSILKRAGKNKRVI